MKEVKKFFQPEFLNRIDEIVFFKPLSLGDVRAIAHLKLESVFEKLRLQNKELVLEEDALLQLCRIGYDYEYGRAQPGTRIARHLLDAFAEMALMEDWHIVKRIVVGMKDEEFCLKAESIDGLPEIVDTTLEEQDYLEP